MVTCERVTGSEQKSHVGELGVPTEMAVLKQFWAENQGRVKRTNLGGGFKVGDTIRLPHYETTGGFRVWNVLGVHLGGEFQEGTHHLQCLDIVGNATIHVPCIILETHPEIEIM